MVKSKPVAWTIGGYAAIGFASIAGLIIGNRTHSLYSGDLSTEESRRLRDFIVTHKSHEVLDQNATEYELFGIAEAYLSSLFALFRKIAVKMGDDYFITKTSWESSNQALIPGSVPTDTLFAFTIL